MKVTPSIRCLVAAGALAVAGLTAAPGALAAPEDLELIQSYVGDWRGTGVLTNAGQPGESVRCRLGVTRSTVEKINFQGRCAIAGTTLSMAGTMAYISANNRYEAIMTSNTTFTGNAIGRRVGTNVTFNLQSTDENGATSRVRAGFGLIDGNISVDFQVTNGDGTKISAIIPFERE